MSASESKPEFTVVNKLDAAERQFETAIWIWFNEGDLVSINTLAGAAFEIFDSLLHQPPKRQRAVPVETPPDGMDAKDWLNLLKKGYNFAKHARTDPKGLEAYSVEDAELFLFFVLVTNVKLVESKNVHGLRKLFGYRFGLTHPSEFAIPSLLEHRGKPLDVERLKKLSRREFFREIGWEFIDRPPSY